MFAVASDPVGTGMVASLSRPGGNVTGLSLQSRELAGKRLDLLREVLPDLRRLAFMGNAGSPSLMLELDELQTAARALGLEIAVFAIRRAADIAPAFAAFKEQAQALYVVGRTRSSRPIGLPSARSPLQRDCRPCTVDASSSRREACCPTARTLLICSGALATMSTRFCGGEAGRHAGRAAHEVRSRHQPDDRQGAGADNSGIVLAARRRGDRISAPAASWCDPAGASPAQEVAPAW